MISTVKKVYFSSCYICFLSVLYFDSTFALNSIECHIQLKNCDLKGTILTTPVGQCKPHSMSVVSLNFNDMLDSGLSSGNERDN